MPRDVRNKEVNPTVFHFNLWSASQRKHLISMHCNMQWLFQEIEVKTNEWEWDWVSEKDLFLSWKKVIMFMFFATSETFFTLSTGTPEVSMNQGWNRILVPYISLQGQLLSLLSLLEVKNPCNPCQSLWQKSKILAGKVFWDIASLEVVNWW